MWIMGNDKKQFRLRKGRCAEAGIAHLEWQCSLTFGKDDFIEKGDPNWNKPTPQAKSARKILELYRWWEARESRPDPMKESGWSEVCENPESKAKKKAFEKLQAIEEFYEQEDEKMLIRLIRLRKHLWT